MLALESVAAAIFERYLTVLSRHDANEGVGEEENKDKEWKQISGTNYSSLFSRDNQKDDQCLASLFSTRIAEVGPLALYFWPLSQSTINNDQQRSHATNRRLL